MISLFLCRWNIVVPQLVWRMAKFSNAAASVYQYLVGGELLCSRYDRLLSSRSTRKSFDGRQQ